MQQVAAPLQRAVCAVSARVHTLVFVTSHTLDARTGSETLCADPHHGLCLLTSLQILDMDLPGERSPRTVPTRAFPPRNLARSYL